VSGIAVLHYLLTHSDPLLDVVAYASIRTGVLPQDTQLPALAIMQVDVVEQQTITQENGPLYTERDQVTVFARTYGKKREIVSLVRSALPLSRGAFNIGGLIVKVDSIRSGGQGPDDEDTDERLYLGTLDFIIKWSSS
jgi:hypothetical protein